MFRLEGVNHELYRLQRINQAATTVAIAGLSALAFGILMQWSDHLWRNGWIASRDIREKYQTISEEIP